LYKLTAQVGNPSSTNLELNLAAKVTAQSSTSWQHMLAAKFNSKVSSKSQLHKLAEQVSRPI
jgi:peptidyl-tRNA hydrolase